MTISLTIDQAVWLHGMLGDEAERARAKYSAPGRIPASRRIAVRDEHEARVLTAVVNDALFGELFIPADAACAVGGDE